MRPNETHILTPIHNTNTHLNYRYNTYNCQNVRVISQWLSLRTQSTVIRWRSMIALPNNRLIYVKRYLAVRCSECTVGTRATNVGRRVSDVFWLQESQSDLGYWIDLNYSLSGRRRPRHNFEWNVGGGSELTYFNFVVSMFMKYDILIRYVRELKILSEKNICYRITELCFNDFYSL